MTLSPSIAELNLAQAAVLLTLSDRFHLPGQCTVLLHRMDTNEGLKRAVEMISDAVPPADSALDYGCRDCTAVCPGRRQSWWIACALLNIVSEGLSSSTFGKSLAGMLYRAVPEMR